MKRRKVLFMHLSNIRLLVKKFAIVLLFLSAFVMMLVNKTDTVIIEKTSSVATDVVSPLIDVLVIPARVIAEEGNAFSHSLIAYTGGSKNVKKGQVVLSDNGVIGRIEQVGKMYSKIILITDINSKIPVIVERTRVRGILSGDNTSIPKLVFIPLDAELSIGDRVVTSGVAGVFPPGLPIGKVSSVEKNNIKIKTFGNLDRLEYVKIVDYGLADMLQQEEIIQPEQTGE